MTTSNSHSPEGAVSTPKRPVLVACLCAAWCGTCREYQPNFLALGKSFPDASFLWIDIEDEADWIGHFDVDDFPTLLIQIGNEVMFFGSMLPQIPLLSRTLEALLEMTEAQARAYVHASEERLNWQQNYNLREVLAQHTAR